MRSLSIACLALFIAAPLAFAQPREAASASDADAPANEKRIKQLNDQIDALTKRIAELRESLKNQPEPKPQPADDFSAQVRKRIQEQLQSIRSKMDQASEATAKLRNNQTVSPQQLKDRWVALLREQLHDAERIETLIDTKGPATRTARPATRPKSNVLETLAAAGNYKVLIDLIKSADMADELKQAEPFTLFAPTDEAFAKLQGRRFIERLKEDKERLVALLKDHIIPKAKTRSKDVGASKRVLTLTGRELAIVRDEDKLTVGPATIIQKDLEASNGVVQGVDAVLVRGTQRPRNPD